MNKWKQFLKTKLADYLSFPKDIMLDLPKITTIGNIHTYIENHQGVVSYDFEKIILQSKIGQIKIIGSSLVIKKMVHKELFLEGEIIEIIFEKKDF